MGKGRWSILISTLSSFSFMVSIVTLDNSSPLCVRTSLPCQPRPLMACGLVGEFDTFAPGKFRVGQNQLLADEDGQSQISMEDYAIALLDEIEQPKHLRQRFTVAY